MFSVVGQGLVLSSCADDLDDKMLLTLVSDQGSTMLSATMVLLYGERQLRAFWFLGWNHQANNIDTGVLSPIGMSCIDEKIRWISKMRYGPRLSPDMWNTQLRAAWQATSHHK